jgi:hypothetical protein
MPQADNLGLFQSILADFHNAGILDNFILIGSWVLRVYREHFDHDPRIPVIATQDLDFLIENPVNIQTAVDVGSILERYDMEVERSVSGQYAKFVGPDLEVEFLFPDKGRGVSGGIIVPELGIVAQPLRYLHFIQDFSVSMEYQAMPVRVPEPVVFVLMKYLLTTKRSGAYKKKIAKDVSTARELESFLLESGAQDDFRERFSLMSESWKKDLMNILREYGSDLVDILN